MDEIIKTLRFFLTRDITYIIGGSTVIGTFYYWFGSTLNMRPHSPASYLVILGLGHFVGFALQSLGNFIRIVNVMDLNKPGRFVLFLYRRFTRKRTWYEPSPLVDARFSQYADERSQAEIDRIVTLKQIAATMGACSGAVCMIVIAKCAVEEPIKMLDVSILAGFATLFCIFAPLSYIMSAQQGQFVIEKTLPERIREKAYYIWEDDKSKLAEACWAEATEALLCEAMSTLHPSRKTKRTQ